MKEGRQFIVHHLIDHFLHLLNDSEQVAGVLF